MKNGPLITVVVITYQSGSYVTETLESIREQEYDQMELIITDDCSSDDTVAICREWLDKHGDRFTRSQIIQSPSQTGIPANCNRGVKEARGEWIKLIAGDDLLLKNCLSDSLRFSRDRHFEFVAGRMRSLQDKTVSAYTRNEPAAKQFFALAREKKIRYYAADPFFLNTPAWFYSRRLAEAVGYFDERYFLVEDQPFVFKALQHGYDIGLMPETTVIYRLHASGSTGSVNKNLYRDLKNIFLAFRLPLLRGRAGKLLAYLTLRHYDWLLRRYNGKSKWQFGVQLLFIRSMRMLAQSVTRELFYSAQKTTSESR